MGKVILLLVCVFLNNGLFAQDTIVCKGEKGFIFMPAFHPDYDKGYVGEMRPAYEDYFFPINYPDVRLLKDSNINILFKNCIRIAPNNFRDKIKKQAIQLAVIDTLAITSWYGISSFYIVPVTINYKLFKDRHPKMMSQDSFVMQIRNGANFHFYPKREAMLPISIKVLSK